MSALRIVESEADYWSSVAEQAEKLLQGFLRRASEPSPRRLPASLKPHLKRYAEFLSGRAKTLDLPLLDDTIG